MSAEDLPEEVWETILNKLDYEHHEPVSIVCKRFLSLTNRLRLQLTVTEATVLTHGTVSPLLLRFPNLKFLNLFGLDVTDNILTQIARSSLPYLETLYIGGCNKTFPTNGIRELGLSNTSKSLRVLVCSYFHNLRDSDLTNIANGFPFLEELDISSGDGEDLLTDDGIVFLSSHLNNLRKINITSNRSITDKSIFALSSNCLLLTQVKFAYCPLITQNAVDFLLRNSPHISILSIGMEISPKQSLSFGRNLCALEFYNCVVSDELLSLVAKASIPLKRLTLYVCSAYTISGIRMILSSCPSIEFLKITINKFLTDDLMISLLPYLKSLVSIELNLCPELTSSTLHALAKSCPILEAITMSCASLGKEESLLLESVKNQNITYLDLCKNSQLNDACLAKIALACPNLEWLRVYGCPCITEVGISEIFKRCRKIRTLNMKGCVGIQSLGPSLELVKLEVLYAGSSRLNDDELVRIANTCTGLKKLDLANCKHVTTRGVESVVQNCKKLREIKLNGTDLSSLIVHWMVRTRPSLKTIFPPSLDAITDDQRNLLMGSGCYVVKNNSFLLDH